MNVAQLKALIAELPDDMPVGVDKYGAGLFTPLNESEQMSLDEYWLNDQKQAEGAVDVLVFSV